MKKSILSPSKYLFPLFILFSGQYLVGGDSVGGTASTPATTTSAEGTPVLDGGGIESKSAVSGGKAVYNNRDKKNTQKITPIVVPQTEVIIKKVDDPVYEEYCSSYYDWAC